MEKMKISFGSTRDTTPKKESLFLSDKTRQKYGQENTTWVFVTPAQTYMLTIEVEAVQNNGRRPWKRMHQAKTHGGKSLAILLSSRRVRQ